jgi:glycosyltransferase involved in cell wall biosynthesis
LLHLRRTRVQEARLSEWADAVTTISPVDAARLRVLARTRDPAITVVPNGVADVLLTRGFEEEELPNTIAFWGVLNFEPNLTAVWHFYRNVFVPYLRNRGIVWYIIGPHPSADLLRLGEQDSSVRVTGFVEDLYGLASKIPVMVNPMIMGSGLKNKALEAFALRRTVVSTGLGMEAIRAVDGMHFLQADTPLTFADAIISALQSPSDRLKIGNAARQLVLREYTWATVGHQWRAVVDRVLAGNKHKRLPPWTFRSPTRSTG